MWKFLTRENRWLFIGSIVGFFLFTNYFSEISLTSNESILLHKHEAIKLALQYLQQLDYSQKDYKIKYAYQNANEIRWYLQNTLGRQAAVDSLRNSFLNGDVWNIYFYQNLPPGESQERFSVQITSDGKLKSFDHQIRDFSPGADLNAKDALDSAFSFISKYASFEPSQYKLKQNTRKLKNHQTYHFTWTKFDPALDGTLQYQIKIYGDRIESYAFDFKIPTSKSVGFQEQVKFKNRLDDFVLPIYIIIFIWFLFEFIRRYNVGKIYHQHGLLLMGFFLIVYLASTLNGLVTSSTEDWVNNEILNQTFFSATLWHVFLLGIFLSIIIYLVWIVGELLLEEGHQVKKLLSFRAIFKSKWLTVNVAKAFTSAFFLAWLALGFIAIYGYFVSHFLNGMVDQAFFSDTFDREFPWLEPIFNGIISAFFVVIILFLSLSTILQKYLKRKYWIILPILIILQFIGFNEISFYPHLYTIILRLALGLFIFYVFDKFDVLTAFMTVFIFISFMYAIPLASSSSNLFLATSGVSACILLTSTLLISILGFRRNQMFSI